jgi:uncharacterized lipoprotein YmbA
MKKSVLTVLLAFVVGAMLGCAASVGVGTGYSVLDTIPPGGAPVPVTQGIRPVVAVGPVGVPGYIVRAETIMESTVSMANISTADQNDAYLAREIPRVITVNIERLLTPKGLAVISSGVGAKADYRIAVDLSAFDVTQFNTLETKGQWALYKGGNAAPVMVKEISFSTPVAGRDVAATRAAMSRALADLTTMIVGDFEGLLGTR